MTTAPLGIDPKTGLPLSGPATIAAVRETTDTVLLSFSGGKDSLAAWLKLREHFRVVPVFLYRVPGLRFVDEKLEEYEGQFGTHIIRLPHPSSYRMLGEMVFQPPENCAVIEELGLPEFRYTYDDLFQLVREEWRLPETTWVATGVRSADSPNRRASINRYGSTREARKPPVMFPVHDMRKDELVQLIRSSGVKLSVDYKLFGRSFDGIDLRYLYPLAEHYPDDFRRILDFFPLADLELFRYECHLRHVGKAVQADEVQVLRKAA